MLQPENVWNTGNAPDFDLETCICGVCGKTLKFCLYQRLPICWSKHNLIRS